MLGKALIGATTVVSDSSAPAIFSSVESQKNSETYIRLEWDLKNI